MATTVGLDEIREDAERQFGDLDVSLPGGRVVRLRHALRLPKSDRERLVALGEQIAEAADNGADEDALLAAFGEVLVLVADTKANARALLRAVEGNLLTLMSLFKRYAEACQLPEASRSTS